MTALLQQSPRRQSVAGEIEITIVMPCLNEAQTVATCVAKAVAALERLGVEGEVIVADNGSSDGSQELARGAGARVVPASRRGYGAALQAGIAAAQSRYILMGDADDSYDFSDIEPFLSRLRAGDDLVMGNRFKGGIRPGAMPWHHKYIGNPVLTGILNLFFHTGIGDAHCGLRAFRKDAVNRLGLRTPGMEFASEMVVKSALHKHKISEVPIVLYPDGRDRPPHLRSFRDGWRHLRFLLLLCPLWLYFVPAIFLLTGGVGLMAWLTPGPRRLANVQLDLHTMVLGMMAVFLGYETLWLGAYAKIHGWTSGLLPSDKFCQRVFDHVNLERGLVTGFLLLITGLGLCGWLISEWSSVDFGALDVRVTLRYALWGCTALVLGVQTIFGSFFLGMLEMNIGQAKEQTNG
jgi:Glycosyl transferase family 2